MRPERSHSEADGTTELYCPKCGSSLQMRVLELDDEGVRETLLLFDCPSNDFHTAMTRDDVVAAMAAAVRARLGF
jgi:uncharacterized OB-fold protein